MRVVLADLTITAKILGLRSLVVIGCVLAACTPNGVYHTVQPGQTLYRIAKAYDIEEQDLARINGIKDPRRLRAGDRLYVPNVAQVRAVPATVPSALPSSAAASKPAAPATPAKPASPAAPVKAEPPRPQPSEPAKPAVSSSPPVSRAPKSTASLPSKGVFVWPVKGKVVSKFGSSADKANKGIEIAASKGAVVVAAAAGKVIYSGNGIRGYGNLIIIEHADDFFTVYGYNQKNLAAVNAFVGQGDRIALAGTPPNSQSPRLHFEIRRGKNAVDPIFYLP